VVQKGQFKRYKKQYVDLITDIDDLTHIHAYFEAECDYFVTTNRRLTQMKMRNAYFEAECDYFVTTNRRLTQMKMRIREFQIPEGVC